MQENPVVLKHGVFLAPFHNPVENPTIGLRQDIELARIADDLGYDEYWFGEHHSGGLETISSPELMIAAAAEVTRRIRLGTGVITLPYHNPLMVANRIAQLDHLTRGRAIFGLGPGLAEDAAMLASSGSDPADDGRGDRGHLAAFAVKSPEDRLVHA